MSNFAFLATEFPTVHEAAVEVAVKWAFRSDPNLKLPYQDNISALLFDAEKVMRLFTKIQSINDSAVA